MGFRLGTAYPEAITGGPTQHLTGYGSGFLRSKGKTTPRVNMPTSSRTNSEKELSWTTLRLKAPTKLEFLPAVIFDDEAGHRRPGAAMRQALAGASRRLDCVTACSVKACHRASRLRRSAAACLALFVVQLPRLLPIFLPRDLQAIISPYSGSFVLASFHNEAVAVFSRSSNCNKRLVV